MITRRDYMGDGRPSRGGQLTTGTTAPHGTPHVQCERCQGDGYYFNAQGSRYWCSCVKPRATRPMAPFYLFLEALDAQSAA